MKRKLITTLTLAALLLSACQYEIIGDPGTPGAPTGGDFNLHLTLDKIESEHALVSRSTVPPTTGEENIQNLALLFFAQTTDASGEFKDAILLQDGPYQMNEDIKISFSGTGLDSHTPYNLLIVGNANEMYLGQSVEDWVATLAGKTEQQVYEESTATVSGTDDDDDNKQNDNSHAIPADEILMTARASRAGGQLLVPATMIRALVRFDVVNSKSEEYNLVSASIWNAYPETSVFDGGVTDYSQARLKRFYGIKNPADDYSNITGGLYAFTNRVVSPEQDDGLTTCLIVGLAPITDKDFGPGQGMHWPAGEPRYFRVNIHSNGSAQALKRNNAYKLTIRGVVAPGDEDETQASTSGANNLSYVINYWDLNDDGLIVYDGDKLLAIPTKTVRLAPAGETRELSIFTFGEGNLVIKKQDYNGSSGIRATLSGNTLTIVAQPLGSEVERTGFIQLTFAGLTATINVIQSPKGDRFLEVATPGGTGIPPFGPEANAPMAGKVTVKASGSWTATLHMDGFSFRENQSVKTLTSAEAPGNAFELFTNSPNDGTKQREAFLLVRLDEDPDNFNAVRLLTQRAPASITVEPGVPSVTFLGNGALESPATSTQEFHVYPTVENGKIYPWKAEILPFGGDVPASDMQSFEFYNPSTNTGGDIQISDTQIEGNRVGVRTTGHNNTDNVLKALLRISLVDHPDKFVEIELFQRSDKISHTPTDIPPVIVEGGVSVLINLKGDNALTWTATVSTYTTTPGQTLVNHEATLVDAAGNDLNASSPLPLTQSFKVKFPKVYYPNREKTIFAKVDIKVNGATTSYPITVQQNMLLTNRAIIAGNMYSLDGSISTGDTPSSSRFAAFREMLVNKDAFGTGKPVPLGPITLPSGSLTAQSIPKNVTYLQANMSDRNYDEFLFSNINTWMTANDVVLVITGDMSTSNNALFNVSTSIFKKLNIKRSGTITTSATVMNAANAADTRIGQYLTTKGPFPLESTDLSGFAFDQVSAAANLSDVTADCKAIAIIGTNNNAGLFVDPAKRIMYIGDSEFFAAEGRGNGIPTDDYSRFLANLVAYIFNTAAYGSSFSDMLIDGTAVPAPWDAAWGR